MVRVGLGASPPPGLESRAAVVTSPCTQRALGLSPRHEGTAEEAVGFPGAGAAPLELRTAVLLPRGCSVQSHPWNPGHSRPLVPGWVLFKALGTLEGSAGSASRLCRGIEIPGS